MNRTPSFRSCLHIIGVAGWLTGVAGAASRPDITSTPFAARSGSGEHMVFTAITSADSGLVVENPYDDPAMWGDRYDAFQGGAIGTGIAIGDVDGDGQVDVYVVNKTRPNQLFRQVAPFQFIDISATAGVPGGPTWKTGATMADVDNDGDLDLYVCQFNGPNLLYLNDGRGRFTEAGHHAGVDLVSGSVVGAFEDFDRDGFLDLYVVTNVADVIGNSEGESPHLYRNRGDGTFTDVSAGAGISAARARGHSATWFDFNGDGWPDLYTANDFAQPDHLYRNNGDGTFTDVIATALPHTPWFSMGSDFADINNDGLVDLFAADMAGTTHFKSKVAMGDMGGLVDHMDTLVTPQYMKNAVYLNSGTDRFGEVAKLTGLGSTDWTWSARFEDLDNDGWVDLHATNGMVRSFTDSDLLKTAQSMASKQQVIALMKSSPPMRETNLMFRNDHDLHFTKVQAQWGLDHTGVSFGSAFADLDHDGDLDLLYVNYDDTVSLYRNDCPATGRSIIVQLKGTTSNSHGMGAQAFVRTSQGTQTRQLTVARGALSSSEPVMAFGLGAAAQVDALEIRWPSGQVQRFENLAADARYVVTEPAGRVERPVAIAHRPADHGLFRDRAPDAGIDFVNQERVFNDMIRQPLLPNRMNTLGGGIAWGDANGDGAWDLFFAGGAGCASALYLNDGQGQFARSSAPQPWDLEPDIEAMSPLWIDVNTDGHPDLLLTAGGVETAKDSDLLRSRLYLNDGHGRFTAADTARMALPPFSASVACAADFLHDGSLGVFIGGRVVPGEYPTTPQSTLLANRHGTLTDVTDTICPALRTCGMVTSALWTDVDRDGWVDLLVVGEWMTPRLFHNTQGTLSEITAEAGFAAHAGWWNALTAADVNNDGFTDYIAGNVGKNTKYHASTEHPARIFYGDFDDSKTCNIIEADYEGDKLFPVRGLSCSSRAMPVVRKKFPTFHDFGSALLPDIYGEDKLGSALQLSANQLASGVFVNDGTGRFTFQELPPLAQAAPIFGLAAVDCNGDGFVDLVAAQNFNGPQVETGRFDGGLSLLLVGDGTGRFTPVAPAASGIAISGEGRGIALGDVNRDGWPDLVLTRINENAMVLLNHHAPAGNSFAIQLRGAVGNADAIGARIEVRFANGTIQTTELYAGSGYLSQSAPLAFCGYAATNPPQAIDVTWPDGTRQSYPFTAGVPHIVLTQSH